MTRRPIDARLPALGLVTVSLSPPTGRPMDPLAFAAYDLLADAEPHALILGLVQVAKRLAEDHAACCEVEPLAVVRGLAYEIQAEELICVRPWGHPASDQPDDNPPAPPTTREEPPVSLLKKAKPEASVPIDPIRQQLDAMFANRPTIDVTTGHVKKNGWDKKEVADEELQAAIDAGEVEVDEEGEVIAARIPQLDYDFDQRDEHLFEWSDVQWTSAAGDRLGIQFAKAGRAKRATALATLGRLTARETEHLQWLAEADAGFESLADGKPITRDQARGIVDILGQTPQRGRTNATARIGPTDLSGILEER